ncbi:MAG TPA: DNA replication and repair protein RecF [Candidatus Saccharimonadales bacterium]|nr:DNA replication and repair protein RecF [Candidatus Saccharimonadales bacterium]
MITDLRLQHFRSYNDASFEIDPGVNIIVGPNASGKTNLLEGVLVVAHGSSYRAKDGELVQFSADWARLDADTLAGKRTVKLQRDGPDKFKKTYIIDDQERTRLSLHRMLPVVVFEPNHLLLLTGSPELRRNFLDDLIEQTVPGYASTRRHYKRVLAQRNALLKRNPRDLRDQLFVWNLRLSELGGQLVRERSALVARFAERIGELYNAIANTQQAVGATYTTEFSAIAYETALLHKLEASLEHDILRGFTAHGPHRDDLLVTLSEHPAAVSASRGEARTLVLALKVLELQLLEELSATRPLFLLDDVFSELDNRRRQALTRFVAEYQSFITTTDADVIIHNFTSSNIIAFP